MIIFGGYVNDTYPADLWVLTSANGLVSAAVQITGLLPTNGGNSGQVSSQVIGSGFQAGATVKLTGLGADLIGTSTSVLNSTYLTTTFNLVGTVPGARNLVIINPDNSSVTLVGGFTVAAGGAPDIRITKIAGPLAAPSRSAEAVD
jgi:hypothetical protein